MAEEGGECKVEVGRVEVSTEIDGGSIGSTRVGDGRTRSGNGSTTSSEMVMD